MPYRTVAHPLSRRQAWWILLIAIGFAALMAVASALRAAPLAWLDHALLDTLLPRVASGAPATDAVVVDVDDVSLAALGQWPWPRYRVAALVERIAAAEPRAVALDILFPEADRSSLGQIQQTFKRDFGIDMKFSGVPSGLLDNDGYLGSVLARHGVVGSMYLYFDHAGRVNGAASRPLALTGRTDLLSLKQATGALMNARAISADTASSGFVNSQLDTDGVLRRAPLLIAHESEVYPSLALAAVMRALRVSEVAIGTDGHGPVLQVADKKIPIDRAGFALMKFNGGPDRYRSISAVDVLSGGVDPEEFAGKIVFVGTTAVGLNDFHSTAVHPHFPGLKLQAAMTENMLHNGFVTQPSWADAAGVAACLLAGALVAATFVWARTTVTIVVVSGLGALGLLAGSGWLLAGRGLFVSAAAPVVVVVVLFLSLLLARYAVEKRRARAWLEQLENAREVAMASMAAVAETRDPETGGHIKRTQHYVRAVAEELRRIGYCKQILTPTYIDLLFLSAPLHDVGKVGVPDHILLKPGRLTADEMVLMKQHAEFGCKIIFSTAENIAGDNFLVIAGEIAGTHHEKWDGTGYPNGLAGDAIPLSGRIMAVADIYDALISRRCYKEPYSHALATTMLAEMRGTTFDPEVLDAFFRIEEEVKAIAAAYKDDAEHSGIQPLEREAHEQSHHSAPPTDATAAASMVASALVVMHRQTGMAELTE